jgi:hypothetical protein
MDASVRNLRQWNHQKIDVEVNVHVMNGRTFKCCRCCWEQQR